jgi:hypothetical protein
MKNLPWKAEKDILGWVIRDSKEKIIFISQSDKPVDQEEECLIACVAVNNAFKYLWDK